MAKLLEEVRNLIRKLHYSYRTEEAYLHWIRQYILFHGKRHPTEMGAAEVSAFLTHLAVKRQVAASTQNQALAALLFFYKNVLKEELPWLKNVERAKRPARIPLVLTRAEVKRLLQRGCNLVVCSPHNRLPHQSAVHCVLSKRGRAEADRVERNRRHSNFVWIYF